VRLVRQLRKELGTKHGTIQRGADQIGCGVESLPTWVKQADIDEGVEPGVTSSEAAELKALRQQNRGAARANDLLKGDRQRALQDRVRLRARRAEAMGRRRRARARHPVVGAMVQRGAPPQPLRRHPARRVRSSILRCPTDRPHRGWNQMTRASIKPRRFSPRPERCFDSPDHQPLDTRRVLMVERSPTPRSSSPTSVPSRTGWDPSGIPGWGSQTRPIPGTSSP
jgi:transposase-like protein